MKPFLFQSDWETWKYRISLSILFAFFLSSASVLEAQISSPYSAFFEEAYQKHPNIPRGVLEAVAYTRTRMRHLEGKASCQNLPVYYGVMGLVEDGKNYFQNSLKRVAELSSFDEQNIKENPRINILAYAAAYATLQQNKRLTSRSVAQQNPILNELSEIPNDNTVHNRFAQDQEFYSVLKEMENPHTNPRNRTRQVFNYEQIFGKENYRVLSADRVTVSQQKIRSVDGTTFSAPGARAATCTAANGQANYFGAIWNPAHKNNYGSRGGESVEFVTIHTVQGSYASAISWFRNPFARVSAHYVIRASDGQITQMVCEEDKAFHVRTDNSKAIGIEHEGFIDDGGAWYTNEMYESSAALVRDIAQRRGINPLQTFGGPPTSGILTLGNLCWKIKGHQHFPNNDHIDPGPFWDWDRYYRLINPTPQPIVLTDRKGQLLDPGKENGNYPDQGRITYLIAPRNATSVKLEFTALDMEGTADKPYDYLDLYDGENENGRFMGRVTGNQPPPLMIAETGKVFIEFRSDCRINKAGWAIRYEARTRNPQCPPPSDLIASDVFPMGATLSWKGLQQADLYQVYLRRKLEQKWTLFRTRRTSINVTGLSSNGFYQWQVEAVCGRDTSALIGAAFITPAVSRTENPQVYTLRLNRGKFHDSGGTFSGYGDGENYVYRIIPPNGGRVVLTFTDFETEADHDLLSVYDGLSLTARKIGSFAGKNLPPRITSTGNGLTLHFSSDNRTNGPGWIASWTTTSGGTSTPPISGNDPGTQPPNPDPDPRPDPGTGTGDPPPPASGGAPEPLSPGNIYHAAAPTTSPTLLPRYTGSFTLAFEDKDRSGRGFANRFYNLAQEIDGSFRSRPESGFFYDDFDRGLHSSWTRTRGNWQVSKGQLVQSNVGEGNSNLYASLQQSRNEVYVYHWRAKMEGNSSNRRHGIHFFASDPARDNRGNSYFIWLRDADSGDYIEIYRTVNDKFERKVRKQIQLETGRVYDYKTIYNPSKGRIEVYINNRFSASWVDRFPLSSGKGISLRSGNSKVVFDDLIVYKSRGKSVKVPVNEGAESPLRGGGSFLVNSLVVDRNIRWSPVGAGTALLGAGASSPSPSPSPPSTSDPGAGSSGDESGTRPGQLQPEYLDDFTVDFPEAENGQQFFLPADFDGNSWGANTRLGFFFDEFGAGQLDPEWSREAGNWQLSGETLVQTDAVNGNTNLHHPLAQTNNEVYLYHWQSKLLTAGGNKRFGLHFFCSNPGQSNRGNSYLVWFRNHETKPDKVEVYRSDNNELPRFRASDEVNLQRNQWYDCKVIFDVSEGLITVYLNNQLVLSWKDDLPSHTSGTAVSFRTGNCEVQFDALRVYKRAPGRSATIRVGQQATDMIRFKSIGDQPAARIYHIHLNANGRWGALKQEETRIR